VFHSLLAAMIQYVYTSGLRATPILYMESNTPIPRPIRKIAAWDDLARENEAAVYTHLSNSIAFFSYLSNYA